MSGRVHHLAGDVRVTVAVSSDPRPRPKYRPRQQVVLRPSRSQRRADIGIEGGHDIEQRGLEVSETHFDLVLDAQSRQPNQGGFPQRQHLPANLHVDRGQFLGGSGGFALRGSRRDLAPTHQCGDLRLDVEHRSTTRFGGVRGDDRCHQRVGQRGGHLLSRRSGGVDLRPRCVQAAVLRRVSVVQMNGTSTLAVEILGQVREQREVAERADQRNSLRHFDIGVPADRVVAFDLRAAHCEGFHSRGLDELEDLVALVFANDLTEDAAEIADVLPQRLGQLSPASCRCDECRGTD